jgi:hypothetical protein
MDERRQQHERDDHSGRTSYGSPPRGPDRSAPALAKVPVFAKRPGWQTRRGWQGAVTDRHRCATTMHASPSPPTRGHHRHGQLATRDPNPQAPPLRPNATDETAAVDASAGRPPSVISDSWLTVLVALMQCRFDGSDQRSTKTVTGPLPGTAKHVLARLRVSRCTTYLRTCAGKMWHGPLHSDEYLTCGHRTLRNSLTGHVIASRRRTHRSPHHGELRTAL